MSETAIKVDHVTKLYKLYDKPMDRLKESLGLTHKVYYKEHYALRDLSFEVQKGETVGIIGTNGAGKSTILKIITGVLNPTEGEVSIEGRISALLELGAGFNGEYTGIENVYLNGTMIGFSREEIDAKLDDIIKFADIGEFIHQPVKTYSSGMFVRLAFAVAINIEPEILIVDEALSVGDAFFQAKCFKKFEEFKEMGKTILFVSHDLSSISRYCDRAILLDHGRKVEEGTPKEIIDIYKKILVNQYDSQKEEAAGQTASNGTAAGQTASGATDAGSASSDGTPQENRWKSSLSVNPQIIEYGDGSAEIVDFAIVDEHGTVSSTIEIGTEYQIKLKARFMKEIENPILAVTIKDLQGKEICGTNTMFEGVYLGTVKAGEERTAVFTQKMQIRGGNYLVSFGVTGYQADDFTVYKRLYDVCQLNVISEKATVGTFDMGSKVSIE
jgi:teichoic acid transport system ATP-binding protein